MSAPEASWHILQYPMVKNTHTVYRLCVHLPQQQQVRFEIGNEQEALQRNENTQLTDWFALNQRDIEAHAYLYPDIPSHYVWQAADRRWTRRQRGGEKVITRMYAVNIRNQELHCLRTLLLHKRGATSFEDLRTIDGHVCDTFLQACQLLNLMADDAEWRRALREATQRDMPRQLRSMFAYMLIYCEISDRPALWEEFRPHFIEDFTRRGMNEDEATQRCLAHIQAILMASGSRLSNFGLPEPRVVQVGDEMVDLDALRLEGNRLRNQLNPEQTETFQAVYDAVHDEQEPNRLFFVDAPAGSGKSFLFQSLITVLQAEEIQIVACAYTGIAAMLLTGGRTLHSRFKLPLNIVETTTSGITPNSENGRLIRSAKLIIIDEISMVTRTIFKIVERTVRDVCGVHHRPFANKVVLVGGDFRQTLPIIKGGFREDIINECVKNSLSHFNFRRHSLLVNMRAEQDQQEFSQYLLDLGNATLPRFRSTHYGHYVEIPPRCLAESVQEVVDFCFGDFSFEYLCNSTILTPYNVTCHEINAEIIERLPGNFRTYLSYDSIDAEDQPDVEFENYTVEFLNTLQPSGFPPHRLRLKVGCIVLLMRNLNIKAGLCNGTRMIIRVLGNRYLDAERLDSAGRLTGQRVFIPRIDLIDNSSMLPFKLKRRQFPVKLAYVMTINKSQGQTFDRVGILLPLPCFAHGQMYVAFSRAKRFEAIKVFIEQSTNQGKINELRPDVSYARNIVYREVL